MPPDRAERRPRRKGGVQEDGAGGNVNDAIVTVTCGAARELDAWGSAVLHLHALGLPAAVPPFPARWLARRGIHADWTAAA